MKAKLDDVAREACVSPATVSRVLNHPDLVRPEVREKVRQSIAKLAYTPDVTGRALKTRRTHTIGAVVPTLGISIFAEGVEALQNRLGEHGYTLLIANAQYDREKELREVRALLERGVDGLVLVGDAQAPELHHLLKWSAVPYVTTYVSRARPGVPAIGIDNEAAAFALTERLLALGHRTFGIVANVPTSNDRSQARLRGAKAALAAGGCKLPARLVVRAPHGLREGRRAFEQLITREPSITAIICTTDALAIGVMRQAESRGFSVPDDLSVSGFDDMEIACHLEPPLTTVSVPATRIGRQAAEILIAIVEKRPIPDPIILPFEIRMRGSTGSNRVKR